MDKNKVASLKEKFDTIVQTIENEDVEFWSRRTHESFFAIKSPQIYMLKLRV